MTYVVGFVTPVSEANKERYIEHASAAAELFWEFGATRVVECWGDDVPAGELTDLARAVKLQEGEVVLFSWIELPSREVRDAFHEKMATDPRMKEIPGMPFDGKRLIYGGFEVVVDR